MVLRSWNKNRGLASGSPQRSASPQRREPTPQRTRMPDYGFCTTSRRSGLIFGQYLAHFEPIIVGFKAQTLETTKKGGFKGDLWEAY